MELNCLYENEITPKEILNAMKKNIYINFSPTYFTSISKEYLNIRIDILNLIRKISNKMCFKSQTFFMSIYYLDILFIQNKKIDCNYNILGLSCLLLAAKYCENDPAVPELKYFVNIYNRLVSCKKYITVRDLFYTEVMTCKMLNHKLNYYTVYDFNSFFFSHNILMPEQLEDLSINFNNNINLSKDLNFSSRIKRIMEKIYKKSRYYLDNLIQSPICLKYNTIFLSIYIMKKSIELTLLNEKHFERYDFSLKDKFLKKTNECFNRIIKEYYNIDYENYVEYPKLLEEYDFIKIFKQIKKRRDDFSPLIMNKANNTSTSFNKTPQKSLNIKSINKKISDINYSTAKKRFYKLKTSNSIHSKIHSTNSLISFSGKNLLKVSYNHNLKMGQKNLFRNLGINNCIENYKQLENKNIFFDKSINNKNEKNKLSILKLNSQNSFNNSSKNNFMFATSPLKLGNSNKTLYNNFQNFFDSNKKEEIIKKTRTKDFEKNNRSPYEYNNKSLGKDCINQNINNNSNININVNLKQPYSKKVIQNFGNKINNFNKTSNNRFNEISQNDDTNLNLELKEKYNEKNKTIYNIVNRMPKFKINNNKNKEETYNDSKNKINKNKNIPNIKKNFKKVENKENKIDKEFDKLININLNSKQSDNHVNTPKGSLFVNKKIKYDFYATSTQINKTNAKKKKFYKKFQKPLINIAKSLSIDNKNNNLKMNNLKQNMKILISKKFSDKINKINNENKEFKGDKKNINYYLDSNDNIFSNTLSTSFQRGRFSLMTLKRDKEQENEKDNKINNKILLTDYTLSGDENLNNGEGDVTEYIETGNIQKFDSKTFKRKLTNDLIRIQVKKNNFENENNKNNKPNKKKEKYGEKYKTIKYQNSAFYQGHSYKNNKNYEESNDEDSNNFNQKNLLFYTLKNNQLEEENNLNNIAQHIKKNPSTIVINNNININFGNKSNLGIKGKKRNKNMIKNSQIQMKNNNPNSLSSLLNKIPLCYKNSESNMNVKKKNLKFHYK